MSEKKEKEILFEVFKTNLAEAKKIRAMVKNNPELFRAKSALKKYQTDRMRKTHQNLLDNPETNGPATFFLSEVYSDKDLSQRDEDLTSLTPIIQKTFPESTMATVALAMELDNLTERLDIQMAMKLGDSFTEEEYNVAFKLVGSKEERMKQLDMVAKLGDTLGDLVKSRTLGLLIKAMRVPAKAVGLLEIHDFMEKGFTLFKDTKDPKQFIRNIIEKERVLMDEMYETVSA